MLNYSILNFLGEGGLVKQKFISNTIMFTLNLVFVMFFQNIFGATNKMVGIVVLIIGLAITEKDLTQNLGVLTIELLIINLLMGILSYLTLLNPILGLVINLFFIFYVTYGTVAGNKKPYHFPFILGYLFLTLNSPPTLSELPGRLVALTGGTFMIVGLQWVFNRNTYTKILNTQLDRVLTCLHKRMERIIAGDNRSYPEEAMSLQDGVSRFMKVTYDRRSFKGPLTPESMYRITEIIAFEKMYYLLEDVAQDYKAGHIDKTVLNELYTFIKDLQEGDLSDANKLISKWEKDAMPVSIINFKKAVQVLQSAKKQEYPLYKQGLFKQFVKGIDKESYAYKFSLRLAILVGFSLFIVQLFNLTYGRWFCFTILALVQPGFEESRQKTIYRFIGTFVGVILFIILISVFKNESQLAMIVLVASYIGTYMNRYDLKMTFITVQALGAAIIGTTGSIVIGNRVFYLIIGAFVAYIGNKFLFTIHQQEVSQHYLDLYEKDKKHLLLEPKDYPHSMIVEAYHFLQVGQIEKEKYQEWLTISFDALSKAI